VGIDYRKHEKPRLHILRPHPIWRGIGCALMIIIPVVSFGLADMLMPYLYAKVPGFHLPPELRGSVTIFSGWQVHNFWAVVGLAVLLIFLLFGLLTTLNSVLNGILFSGKRTGASNHKPDTE
jgi:hypothetical protein